MVRPRKPLNEQYVIRLYEAGHSLPKIAAELDVDRSRVTRVVKEAGIYQDQRGQHWLRKRQSREE
jgi:transposase-like protein